ncbi:MAG TPA: hypothetical protein VLB47_00420 [Solirubrobacteraceae bacterium]|nr:hypothetical protein [Solirubrobacteraceae bacterium]
MRRAFPVAVWGLILLGIALAGIALGTDPTELGLGFGLSGAVILGGTTLLRSRAAPEPGAAAPPEAIPDLSVATAVLAAGVATAVVGAELGQWLVGIGLGLAVAGAGGLLRELRAERRGAP